jgi:uncharacterized repeat protein (TIGR02543 family)
VTFIDENNAVLQTERVAEGGSSAPPAAPTRAGYTFTGWDRGPEAWTGVHADAVIKAGYAAEDETVVTTPGGTDITENPTPLAGVGSSIKEMAKLQNIPVIGAPLFAPERADGTAYNTYAILNITLATLAALLALIFSIMWLRKERRANRERLGSKHKGLGWLTAAVALAALNIIVTIPTQDITFAAVWTDKWTAVSAILLAAGAVAGALGLRAPKPAAGDSYLP